MKNEEIEKEKVILQNLFNVFARQKNKRDFYIDLAKYIEYIKQSPVYAKIVQVLEQEIRDNLSYLQKESNKIKKNNINKSKEVVKSFENKRLQSNWGAWERLLWVYFALSKDFAHPDYECPPNKTLGTNKEVTYTRSNDYIHFCFELEEIVSYKLIGDEQRTPHLLNTISEFGNKRDDPNEIDFFRSYATRVHTYLLNELQMGEVNGAGDRIPVYIDNNFLISLTPKPDENSPTYQLLSHPRKKILKHLLKHRDERFLRNALALYALGKKKPSILILESIPRMIRDMNDVFIDEFDFLKEEKYKLISSSKRKGYKINNEKFNIHESNEK